MSDLAPDKLPHPFTGKPAVLKIYVNQVAKSADLPQALAYAERSLSGEAYALVVTLVEEKNIARKAR